MKTNLRTVRSYSIRCDDPDEYQRIEDYDGQYCDDKWTAQGKMINKAGAIQHFLQQGWRQEGKVTLCPKCAERRGIK